jgi:lysophospholipase L1-like esterase
MSPPSRGREIAYAFVASILGLILLEGLASVMIFLGKGLAGGEILPAEHEHTRFDAELGWVHEPNVDLPNLYGPGVALRTNSRGFRGRREVSDRVGEARVRVVCSGDSFTLGYGVSDDEAWPAVLERLSPIFETVNMGQGGYGLDQAYLWYLRDGLGLEHDVHVVAFITDDFTRMMRTRSSGVEKPRLVLNDADELVTTNVPLRKISPVSVMWAQNAHLLHNLRFVELTAAILGRQPRVEPVPAPERLGPVVVRLFEDLANRSAGQRRLLLAAYLPTASDYRGDPDTDRWRTFLAEALGDRGIEFLDLVAPFRSLPYDEAAELFLRSQKSGDLADGGHYSPEGNRFAAAGIAAWLRDAAVER